MKRDMDLVRAILFKMEGDTKQASFTSGALKIKGYTQQQIAYHMEIMTQADLLHVKTVQPPKLQTPKLSGYAQKPFTSEVSLHYYSISWQGHEFLDAARDNNIWKQAKAKVAPLGEVAFDVLKAVLVELAKAQLGLRPG